MRVPATSVRPAERLPSSVPVARANVVRESAKPSDIPNVQQIIATHTDPIARNEAFNSSYAYFARRMQQVVDPSFANGKGASGIHPNWYAVGAHASPQVGRGMLASDMAMHALELLRGSPNAATRAEAFDAMKLTGDRRKSAEHVASALQKFGASEASATAVSILVSLMDASGAAMNEAGIASDPRTMVAVGYRVWNLLRPGGSGVLGQLGAAFGMVKGIFGGNQAAQDSAVLANAEKLCLTFKSLLADGNKAIFGDIGASAERYLRARDAAGRALTPDEVLTKVKLPGATAGGSRKAYEFAVAHAFDKSPPSDFRKLGVTGNDLVTAGFALYELAGKTQDGRKKNALISMANNYIAWREQYEAVQPAFFGQKPGQMDRAKLMSAFTPAIQVAMGETKWTFAEYSSRLPDRDHNPLTSHASEYNWATFDDRWPGILDAFKQAYANEEDVWKFPRAQVR